MSYTSDALESRGLPVAYVTQPANLRLVWCSKCYSKLQPYQGEVETIPPAAIQLGDSCDHCGCDLLTGTAEEGMCWTCEKRPSDGADFQCSYCRENAAMHDRGDAWTGGFARSH
jgi:hypothetical protein